MLGRIGSETTMHFGHLAGMIAVQACRETTTLIQNNGRESHRRQSMRRNEAIRILFFIETTSANRTASWKN